MSIQSFLKLGKVMAIPFMLAACNNTVDLAEIEQPAEEVHPRLSFTCESSTRSVVNAFDLGAQIGVYVTNSGTTSPYGGVSANMNISYTLKGDDYWTTSYSTNLEATQADVYGYYPFQNGVTTGSVALQNGTDHLYTVVHSTINRNNPAATIRLNHAMSLLKFDLDASLGNVARIRIRNLPVSGTLNVFTGSVTASTVLTNVDIYKDDLALSEGFLAIPGYKMDIMVYTDKGSYVWKPETATESGKQYNITLSVQ